MSKKLTSIESLPAGVILSKEEAVLSHESIMFSILFFFLNTDIYLTDKRIIVEAPRVVLGMIPVGREHFAFPLRNIAGIQVLTDYRFRFIIPGIILIILGVKGNVISLIFGILFLLVSFSLTLTLTNNAGQKTLVPVSLLESAKAKMLVQEVSTAIAEL